MARKLVFLLVVFSLAAFVSWALFGQTFHLQWRAAKPVGGPVPQASPTPPAASAQPSPSPAPAVSASAIPTAAPGTFKVAIIIDDAGQWPTTERGYLALPIPLTLSVLPHVRYTTEIAKEAADAGKGVMLHLPMEPLGRDTAGPGEITTVMDDAQIAAQTEDDIAQVPLAKGTNNHEGSKASADTRVMHDVIAVVKSHDLFFIDSLTNSQSVGAQVAQDAGVPTASRSVFLDNKADVAYTEKMLELTVAVARRDGSAIAIGHPRPTTLAALQAMYPKMQAEGVQFVLASELVH